MEVYVKMCRYENFLLEITMQEKILEVLYNYSIPTDLYCFSTLMSFKTIFSG